MKPFYLSKSQTLSIILMKKNNFFHFIFSIFFLTFVFKKYYGPQAGGPYQAKLVKAFFFFDYWIFFCIFCFDILTGYWYIRCSTFFFCTVFPGDLWAQQKFSSWALLSAPRLLSTSWKGLVRTSHYLSNFLKIFFFQDNKRKKKSVKNQKDFLVCFLFYFGS